MKTISIIAAALVSGAAYGHSPCPEDYYPVDNDPDPVRSYDQYVEKLHAWRESERQEDERDYREEQAQQERERQTELMEEMVDALQDLDR